MEKKHKIIIAVAVAVILLIGLGVWGYGYWQKSQEAQLGYLQFNDFIKQSNNSEVYYTNQKLGLQFKIPEGWTAGPSVMDSLALFSPDYTDFKETDPTRMFLPKTGCWIGVSAKKTVNDDADYAITKDRLDHQDILSTLNMKNETYDVVSVSGKTMLRRDLIIDSNKNNTGKFLTIEFAENNKYYRFETYLFGQDQEKCSQIFDDFLKTVSLY